MSKLKASLELLSEASTFRRVLILGLLASSVISCLIALGIAYLFSLSTLEFATVALAAQCVETFVLAIVAILYGTRSIRGQDGWLVVCAWSHKVKYQGEWMDLEDYLTRVHRYRVSHGIAPKSLAEIRSEFQAPKI